MTTCFMINNPSDLSMNLTVNAATNSLTTFDGTIEKYKVDFDAELKQAIITFKMYGDSKFYKLRMVADTAKSLEEFTSTEHFFQIVNVWGLTINHAKSKNKSLSIKVDNENSYVYLDNLVSNDGSTHKFYGWLEH